MGIVENIPIQVGKFFIFIDFVVIEMKEDTQTPLLLGRPFLSTMRAMIDVKHGRLILEVVEEKVVLILINLFKYPSDDDTICRIDDIDAFVVEEFEKITTNDLLGHIIANPKEEEEETDLENEGEQLFAFGIVLNQLKPTN